MANFHPAEVVELLETHPGLQRLRVRFDHERVGDRAYVLTDMVGPVAVGDRVICNTSAVDLGLGTGGWHVVHWNLSRASLEVAEPGHIMKARYTSLQFSAGTSELDHREVDPLDLSVALRGLPVVACLVHSQVAVVASAVGSVRPGTRVAYVMTDGAALPIVLSDLVRSMRGRGLIAATVTAGNAFGGELEAVTVPSALVLARAVIGADVVIVGMGPGVVGTGTQLGTTATEAAAVLDAVRAMGGEPVLCVRASDGDGRDRHRGISHHTRTVCALTTSRPWVVPWPSEAGDLPGVRVGGPVNSIEVGSDAGVAAVMQTAGVRITTMGRDHYSDPLFFQAAVAAGAWAAELVDGPR